MTLKRKVGKKQEERTSRKPQVPRTRRGPRKKTPTCPIPNIPKPNNPNTHNNAKKPHHIHPLKGNKPFHPNNNPSFQSLPYLMYTPPPRERIKTNIPLHAQTLPIIPKPLPRQLQRTLLLLIPTLLICLASTTSSKLDTLITAILTAMIAVQAGTAAMAPTWLSAAGVAALVTAVEVQTRLVEEPYLARTHGDTYTGYASRTGRFVPLLGRLRHSGASNVERVGGRA